MMNTRVMVARKQRGLTQEQLAEQVGLNQADIVRIERHGWTPPPTTQQKIAEALDALETELFEASTATKAP